MDLIDLKEKEIKSVTLKIKELQCEVLSAETQELLHSLSGVSKKQRFRNMFDYHKSVAAEIGEDRSFYSTDFANVIWKCQQWEKELPRVQMFYAVKANPDPILLRLLVLLGVNFDCATEGEIQAVMFAGASADRIVFANPVVTFKGLKYAKKVQVSLITFDSEEQLHKVYNVYPEIRLLLRICPTEVNCGFDFSEKFGCTLDNSYHLLRIAKELRLNVVGVSFHVGSLNTSTAAFASTVRDCRQVFDYAQSLGFCFSILDIGGGFQGGIGTDSLFQETAQVIRESLSIHFPINDVQVIAEPGCYVVCSAVSLTTTITNKKIPQIQTGGSFSVPKRLYFLNDSIYCSFLPANDQYGMYCEPLLSQQDLLKRPRFKSSLFGQTLCSLDVIRRDVILEDMRVGESVVWKNMGAYSQTLNTRFCGFEVPDSRYVFQRDRRLQSYWIENYDEIVKYLSNFVYVIEEED